MSFTANDHKFMRALKIDPDEPRPEPTNEELANAIIARGFEDEDGDPITMKDWEDYAIEREVEARVYYKKWKESEWEAVVLERRNRNLRYALFVSASFSSVMSVGGLIYLIVR